MAYDNAILISEALSKLNNVIRHPEAQHPDNIMAYDNAVSALGKICQFHRDGIDATQVNASFTLAGATLFWRSDINEVSQFSL